MTDSLDEKLAGQATGKIEDARKYIGYSRDLLDYLRRDLSGHFESLPDEERKRRESLLEMSVEESIARYDKELYSIGAGIRKAGTKGAMALSFFNDLYAFFSKIPFVNSSAVSYVLLGAKTLAEIPAIYSYMKKSHDWYGLAKYALLKPVSYLLPLIGPIIEGGIPGVVEGSFERMVKQRVRYEAKNRFLEKLGEREPVKERVEKSLREKVKDWIRPVPNPIYEPLPAAA